MDHLLRIKKELKGLKKEEIEDVYRNKLDRVCFQHDMTYGDLPRRTASDKVLREKPFNIAKNPVYDGY